MKTEEFKDTFYQPSHILSEDGAGGYGMIAGAKGNIVTLGDYCGYTYLMRDDSRSTTPSIYDVRKGYLESRQYAYQNVSEIDMDENARDMLLGHLSKEIGEFEGWFDLLEKKPEEKKYVQAHNILDKPINVTKHDDNENNYTRLES